MLKRVSALLIVAAAVSIAGSVFRSGPRVLRVSEIRMSHGRFDSFPVFSSSGAPTGFALLLSGRKGWDAAMTALARRLAAQGTMVTGIDFVGLKANLEADDGQCVFPDGDFENLSHFVQAYYRLTTYMQPILIGYDAGAAMAYATLAQAPKNTFRGALSLGFCPTLPLRKPLCKSAGLDYIPRPNGTVDLLPSKQVGNPWTVLQGGTDTVCAPKATSAFVAQVPDATISILPNVGHEISTQAEWMTPLAARLSDLMQQNGGVLLPPPAELRDLPIVAVPAPAQTSQTDSFAIFLSGDGGWAGLDQNVAAALIADGIPVIGLDSLRYFWSPRTPQGIGEDIDRMIRYYSVQLRKQRVLLVGYSQGADVLPFAVNRLSPATRAHVGLAAVMGMSEHALFEFHMTSWVSDDESGPPTLPEIERITETPVLCIYGEDESDSLCPKLDPHRAKVVKLKGGHHFDGNYAALAQAILDAVRRPEPVHD